MARSSIPLILARGGVLTLALLVTVSSAPLSGAFMIMAADRGRQPFPATQASTALWGSLSEISHADNSLVATPFESNGALVLYAHGAGQSYLAAIKDEETAILSAALLNAGFTVGAVEAGGTAWGNASSVAAYNKFLDTTLADYRLGRIYVIGESMGGLPAAVIAAMREDVRAWVGIYPVCDLQGLSNETLIAQIEGIYPDGRPRDLSPADWSAKPVMVWASPDDTVVPAQRNSFVCGLAENATVHVTEGQHGDVSNFDAEGVVNFFESH